MSRPRSQVEFDALTERVARQAPVTRKTTVRVFNGKLSDAGELFSRENAEFIDGNFIETIDLLNWSNCDFGHLIGSNGVEVAGRCFRCRRWVCSAPGCARTCVRCGRVCCGQHSFVTADGAYCHDHVPAYLGKKAALGVLRLTGRALKALWNAG